MTRIGTYPQYRDVDSGWLGKVPSHWEVVPAFVVLRPKLQRNIGLVESRVLSLSYGQIVDRPEEKLRGLVPESFETYQVIEPDDIVIRTTDLQNDRSSLRVGICRVRGIITSAYMCLETVGPLTAEYGYQFLNAFDLLKVIYGYGSGLRQNLDFDHIRRMPILVPPREEQAAIVTYLAEVEQTIARYIAGTKRLIGVSIAPGGLLREYQTRLIADAVTGKIDVSAFGVPDGRPPWGAGPESFVRAGQPQYRDPLDPQA